MATTQFILKNDFSASNGTSNLMHLLGDEDQAIVRSLMPYQLEEVFGMGQQGVYEPTRGYEDDEWYFESSDGCCWGIGWRWGQARLRGRGPDQKSRFFWVNPSPAAASEFVAFLKRQILV